jgi:two-component system response regulator DegU
MNESNSTNRKRTGKIRLYLADDHEIFRTGLRTILRYAGDLDITGESGISPDLLARLEAGEPDIVILGAQNDISGTLKSIKDQLPKLKILVMGTPDGHVASTAIMTLDGYIKKDSSPELLRSAIKTILLGGTVWHSGFLSQLMENADKPQKSQIASEFSSDKVKLTDREKQLLVFLADGKTNMQISLELHLAQVTIKKALQALFIKIRAANRTQAVIKASRLGLLQP